MEEGRPSYISTLESTHPTLLHLPPSTHPSSNPNNSSRLTKRKYKRGVSPYSASTASSSSFLQRGLRLTQKRKAVVRFRGETDLDAFALPLGMSFAAFVAQVLDQKCIANGRISADHLSVICSSAVKESLAKVFGNRFDCFVRNFEISFGSTLCTLQLTKEASPKEEEDSFSHSCKGSQSLKLADVVSLDKHGHPSSSSDMKSHLEDTQATFRTSEPISFVEEVQENTKFASKDREVSLRGQVDQQLACVVPSMLGSGINSSVLSAFEKSVREQSRSNDLKTFEIGLMMKRLQLEESQLELTSASNHLERFKLSFGISKVSFKKEKFKNDLEETRHAELLKKCIDCLVAGLVIMSGSLVYGAYVYSYQRLSEVTTSCMAPPKETCLFIQFSDSTSWWMPKSVSSFNSGLHMLRCQILVASRMLFGVFIILAIAYLLLQRSSASNQSMPVTFILLLLGVLCGFAGKLCVDTLGGSGYNWLLYWEALCLLHFFANVCTSTLFSTLHGSVSVSQGVIGTKAILPYWFRRFVFYSVTLFWLPLFCGLMPFAGFSDWKEHFCSLAKDSIIWPINVDES